MKILKLLKIGLIIVIGLSLCVQDKNIRSSTSITLLIKDEWFNKFSEEEQRNVIKKIVSILDKEGVAKDIIGYPKAPPSLKIMGWSNSSK